MQVPNMNEGLGLAAQYQPKVVVVDDEPFVLGPMAGYLSHTFAVSAFSDPAKALQHLEHCDADLVIADYAMPQMDGYTFITRARRLQPWVRTMMISGQYFLESGMDSSDASTVVDAFITKTAGMASLESCCRRLLGV
ncbi:MAG: response regulator [Deltaproteobacteria bacterium]|nr:response regulator [Deltaproteobacteria bacterium]